eukprot:5129293-Prymnesium_polylepis.1
MGGRTVIKRSNLRGPAQHPVDDAPRHREPTNRPSVATQARTGRRATWAAHGYLSVLSSTRVSCQTRHRRARVALDTALRRTIDRPYRPQAAARTGRRATWTAQGDYLLVLSLIHISEPTRRS